MRRSRMSAARRMRSSSPSGRTMWRRSATARSIDLVLEHQRGDRVGAGHLEPVEQHVAVDVLGEQGQRRRDLARRLLVQPARHVSAVGVAWVPRSVAMIGIAAPSPSISRLTCSGRWNPPLSTMPDICGKLADWCAVSTPSTTRAGRRGDDDGALEEPVEHVGHRHRRDHEPGTSAPAGLVAADQGAAAGRHQVGHRGRAEQRAPRAGRRPARRRPRARRRRRRSSGSTRLATMANRVPWLASSSASAIAAADLLGQRPARGR